MPKDDSFDCIMTMTNRLGADIQIVPCNTKITAEDLAYLFFDRWYCKNGCPSEIISDHNKLFISKFWQTLMKLTGIKHKLSTVYHPQTDSASERLNRTIIQCLQFHVERNQKGWAKALPKVRFNIMNTVNALTGFSPFILKTSHSPHLLPPLVNTPHDEMEPAPPEAEAARQFIKEMEEQTLATKDNLLAAKVRQAHAANKDRQPKPAFNVRDKVMLAMGHPPM